VASIDTSVAAPAGEEPKKEAANGTATKAARTEAAAPVGAAARGKNADDLSPAVRYQTEEKGINPASIQGTGKDGRILKGDVLAQGDAAKAAPAATPAPKAPGEKTSRRKMTPLRQKIAARLLSAQPPDDVQRGRSLEHHGAADEIPGPVRQEARDQARLHVVFREGGGPRAPCRARDQHPHRR
jgi:hypothetical protein